MEVREEADRLMHDVSFTGLKRKFILKIHVSITKEIPREFGKQKSIFFQRERNQL